MNKRTRKIRRKGGSVGLMLNYAVNKGRNTPDYQKKAKKIAKILDGLSKSSDSSLRSYKINNIDRTFNLSSVGSIADGFSPIGDDTDKFTRTLKKIPYEQLSKFKNNPKHWSEEHAELFMMKWRTTPSPKSLKTISRETSAIDDIASTASGLVKFIRDKTIGKSRKKHRKAHRSKGRKKGKKDKTKRR